jgi:hypothetical protein
MGCHLWASLSLRLATYYQQLHLGGLCCDAASRPNAVRSCLDGSPNLGLELEVRLHVPHAATPVYLSSNNMNMYTCNDSALFLRHPYQHIFQSYPLCPKFACKYGMQQKCTIYVP